MNLIRQPHFRQYVEDVVAFCYVTQKGLSDAAARAKFKDTFYEDYNMLTYVLDNVLPNTYRDGDTYKFVSHDNFVHKEIVKKVSYDVGRLTLEIRKGNMYMFFGAKNFVHGHARNGDGSINCHGGYPVFASNVCNVGFASALMEMVSFAGVSKYHTEWGEAVKLKETANAE